ncbi:unnamed protein product [Lathyrus sativus]|nr:unnamed protein product [Lathyrus sativus]
MTSCSFPIHSFVPVGFRFRPTDQELVNHYLTNKLLGNVSVVNNVIAEVDVCKFEPWELPGFSVIKSDDPEWFFLSPRDYKYANSKRFNRATKYGFWKATGNDRKIKIRGSDKVIGTKKTLVYYKGRVPGVKTNWVIHEYHAVNFEDAKRTFVLCRLMKKAEKKTEEEADIMICDEGEPSRHISSDCEIQEAVKGIPDVISDPLPEMNMESIFQEPHQAGRYIPFSTQQSLISENEQEVSVSNFRFPNAYFGNENIDFQSPFETIEEEEKFVNSMLIDREFVSSEKRRQTFVNGSIESESLRMVYYENSDADVEVVSTPPLRNFLDTSTMYLEHPSSRKYGSARVLSFNNDESKDEHESTYYDDFGGVEASSCDSTAGKPLEMSCFEISSSSSTPRRDK